MEAWGKLPPRLLPFLPLVAAVLLVGTVGLTSLLYALYYEFSVQRSCEVLGGNCDSVPGDLPSISFTFIPGVCYPISAVGLTVASLMMLAAVQPVHSAIEEEGKEILGDTVRVPLCFCCATVVPMLPHSCHMTAGEDYESYDKDVDEECEHGAKPAAQEMGEECFAQPWPMLRLRGIMRILVGLSAAATLLLAVVGVVNLRVNATVHEFAASLMFVSGVVWLALLTALQTEMLSSDRGDFRFRLRLKQAGCAILFVALVSDVVVQIAILTTPGFAGPSSWSAGAVNEYLVTFALCLGFLSLTGDLMARNQRSFELDQARSELAEGLLG